MNRRSKSKVSSSPETTLRIIGGKFRGSRLKYSGDERTRPMKDRVREAVFNLVGPSIVGSHAIDLFAGTGALALEALSRGAVRATAVERHFPTARVIEENARHLGVSDVTTVKAGDTFIWAKQLPELGNMRWTVFCSPPYALYESHREEMLGLITTFANSAPSTSRIIVEADTNFNFSLLNLIEGTKDNWDVREYPPAVIGMWVAP